MSRLQSSQKRGGLFRLSACRTNTTWHIEPTIHLSRILLVTASPMCHSFHSRFTPLQSRTLSDVAVRLRATSMQVTLAWLLQRSFNILLIPGTSSLKHLRENLQAAMLQIP